MVYFPSTGELRALRAFLTKQDLMFRAYSNAITPNSTHKASSFTQSTAAGYNPVKLESTGWVFSQSSGRALAVYGSTARRFTLTGAITHYGTYVTSTNSTELFWAERYTDTGGHIFGASGGTDSEIVRVTLRST